MRWQAGRGTEEVICREKTRSDPNAQRGMRADEDGSREARQAAGRETRCAFHRRVQNASAPEVGRHPLDL